MAKVLNIVGLSSKFVKTSFNASLYKTQFQFQKNQLKNNFRSFASINSKFDRLVEEAKKDLIRDSDGNIRTRGGNSSIDQQPADKIDFSDDELTVELLEEVRDGKLTSAELEQMFSKNYQDEEYLKDIAAKQLILSDNLDQLEKDDDSSVAVSGQEGEEYTYDYDYDYDDNAEGLSELELSESEDEEAIAKQKRDEESASAEKKTKYLSFINTEMTKIANFHRERNILRSAIDQARTIEQSGQVKAVQDEEEIDEEEVEEVTDQEVKNLQVDTSELETVDVGQFINRIKSINSDFSQIEKEIDLTQTQEQQLSTLEEVIPKLRATPEEQKQIKAAFTEQISQYHKSKEAIRKSFQTKAAQIKDNSFFNGQFEKYN